MLIQQQKEIGVGQRGGVQLRHLKAVVVLVAIVLLHPALLGILLQGDGVLVGLQLDVLHLVILDQLDQLAELDLHLAGHRRSRGDLVDDHHNDDGPDDDGHNAHHIFLWAAAFAVFLVISFIVQGFFLLCGHIGTNKL